MSDTPLVNNVVTMLNSLEAQFEDGKIDGHDYSQQRRICFDNLRFIELQLQQANDALSKWAGEASAREAELRAEIERLKQCCGLDCDRANHLGAVAEALRARLQQIHDEATAPLCASYEYDATPTAEERLRKIAGYSAPQT
jgi:hypothetical protein